MMVVDVRDGVGQAVDLFDAELGGGRDEPEAGEGRGCSTATLVTVGIFLLLAVLIHTLFGWVGDLFSAVFS
ncbi:hypothetical protein ABZ778_04640 [Streptomyces bacillaris]|uniref:hypothetical protein n=1 Tax=Streptomyces bacillaris TaxID=68179 RepID=UPI0010086153